LQQLFIDYMQLHGQLIWDGGLIAGSEFASIAEDETNQMLLVRKAAALRTRNKKFLMPGLVVAAVAVLMYVGINAFSPGEPDISLASRSPAGVTRHMVTSARRMALIPVPHYL
jgi:hypothetical protein